MYYVYLLHSIKYPDEIYIGSSSDVKSRVIAHNAGQSPHTSKFKPWRVICFIGLPTKTQAEALEKYLKSGSGRAFIHKRLM